MGGLNNSGTDVVARADAATAQGTADNALAGSLYNSGYSAKTIPAVRNQGVVYTNTGQRPLFVSVSAISAAPNERMVATMTGGIPIVGAQQPTAGLRFSVVFLVPIGVTYRIDGLGVITIAEWIELELP